MGCIHKFEESRRALLLLLFALETNAWARVEAVKGIDSHEDLILVYQYNLTTLRDILRSCNSKKRR